ncbi:hypothetical protein PROPEN_01628 [Proteus penneri ATCC 35198]|nr:hypothetical protein PROPEN_01628 [Proteus penneri ATCC 35198]
MLKKRVILNGEIFFIDSLGKVFIQNSTDIRFNQKNSDNILIKYLILIIYICFLYKIFYMNVFMWMVFKINRIIY